MSSAKSKRRPAARLCLRARNVEALDLDEQQHRFTPLSLFAEGRLVPADAIDSVQVKLSEMKLERARPYGNCWLGCELWRQLHLDRFWTEKLPHGRESVAWPHVLELLVVNRLIDPGSEFRIHRQWFEQSVMDVLLAQDFTVAEKDRLNRCLDRVLEHKQELFAHSNAGKICFMWNSICCYTT
jgi:hypothetical protein